MSTLSKYVTYIFATEVPIDHEETIARDVFLYGKCSRLNYLLYCDAIVTSVLGVTLGMSLLATSIVSTSLIAVPYGFAMLAVFALLSCGVLLFGIFKAVRGVRLVYRYTNCHEVYRLYCTDQYLLLEHPTKAMVAMDFKQSIDNPVDVTDFIAKEVHHNIKLRAVIARHLAAVAKPG